MIKIKGTYMVNGDIFNYSDYADTIEEAVRVIDYRFWFNYKILLRFYYKDKLLRRLSDDCEFDEEILFLKEQISKIDENEIERCKYEN